MTPRERLLAFLSNQETDRVPIWLLFPWHPMPGVYADVRSLPSYKPILDAAAGRASVLNRRYFNTIPLFTPEVTHRREQLEENGVTVRRESFGFRGVELCNEIRTGPQGSTVKKMLATEEDLDTYLSFPVQTDPVAIAASLAPLANKWRQEAAEFPEEFGAMMTSLSEPVSPIYHYSDLGEFPVWSITAGDKIKQLLDRFMEHYRIVYRCMLEQDIGEVFFMTGSELAAPPMVSKTTFQQWVVPYSCELIDLIHSYGKKVIQHFHGQIHDLLPDFVKMGADAVHTIEAPPIGNCTLTQAFDVVGDRVGLIGNIQYDDFRSFTRGQMDEAVRKCLEETRGKRFMLSPTAGPFDAHISESFRDNYIQFIESGWKYGAK
jgi:hypothetical protein